MAVFLTPNYFVQLLGVFVLLVTFAHESHSKDKQPSPGRNKKHAIQALTPKQQMSAHTEDLRELMLQLYEAYPEELAKSTQVGAREMTEWVFDGKTNWKFDAIRGAQGKDALDMIYDQTYQGDAILPLVVGLETLLFTAYGAKNEFDIPSEMHVAQLAAVYCDIQKLYQQFNQPQVVKYSEAIKNIIENKRTKLYLSDVLQSVLSRLLVNNGIDLACN